MDASATYAFFTFAWVSIQSIPLLITPSMLLPLLTSSEASTTTTPLTIYLARTLALTQLALASNSLLLTGQLPLSRLIDIDPAVAAAYKAPSTIVTTLFHYAAAFHCWTAYAADGGLMGFALGALGSGMLAAFGTWCLLFGAEPERRSKRTGGDKRVSGWPFGDKKGRREGLKKGGNEEIELKEM